MYNSIMVKALADRLAEVRTSSHRIAIATTEVSLCMDSDCMHGRVAGFCGEASRGGKDVSVGLCQE